MPEAVKARVKADVGDFLKEQVLLSLSKAETPIVGENWPGLSKKYAEKKKAEGLPAEANMELEGDMLDSMSFEATSDGLELGFFGSEAAKADGHLKFSGRENNTPQRRFLPDEGQEFDPDIQDKAEQIVRDAMADEVPVEESLFEHVETKADLLAVLEDYFPGLEEADIFEAVMRTPELVDLLDEMDLLDLL